MPWSSFSECWALSQLFHSPPFTFMKRLLSSSSLSAITVVSSTYLRLLLFLCNLDSSLCFIQHWLFNLHAPLSMGFSRQEYCRGLPCFPPGDLPNPGIKPVSLTSLKLANGLLPTRASWEVPVKVHIHKIFPLGKICFRKYVIKSVIFSFNWSLCPINIRIWLKHSLNSCYKSIFLNDVNFYTSCSFRLC